MYTLLGGFFQDVDVRGIGNRGGLCFVARNPQNEHQPSRDVGPSFKVAVARSFSRDAALYLREGDIAWAIETALRSLSYSAADGLAWTVLLRAAVKCFRPVYSRSVLSAINWRREQRKGYSINVHRERLSSQG